MSHNASFAYSVLKVISDLALRRCWAEWILSNSAHDTCHGKVMMHGCSVATRSAEDLSHGYFSLSPSHCH